MALSVGVAGELMLAGVRPAFSGCTASNATISICDATQTVAAPTAGTSSLTIDGVSTIGVFYSPTNLGSPGIFNETLNVTGQTTISNVAGQFGVNGGVGISMVQTTSGTNGVLLNSTITVGSGVTIASHAQYGAGIFLASDAGGNLSVSSAANITVTGVDSSNVQVSNATVLALAANASTYADGINAVTNLGSSSVTNSGTVTAYSGRGLYSEGNAYAVTLDANENIVSTSGPAVTVSADNTASGVVNAYIPGIRVIDYYGLAEATNEGYVHSTTRQAIVTWSSAGDSSITNSGTASADDRNAIVSQTERGNNTITNSGTVTAAKLTVGSIGGAAGYSGLRATADYTGDIVITNTSTGIITANDDAAIVAHTPQGNATVTNQGQVTGLSGVFIDSGAGVGTIDTLNDTSGPAVSAITGAATLINSGTITATAYGAYLDGTTNALTNSGTITTTGATAIVTGNGDSTVTNSGTISAGSASGTAISFGSGNNRLVLADTSSITGIVTNASTNNTLELTGTGSGTLALGLVSSSGDYQGFTNLDKTGSGQWTLTGSGGSLTGTVAVDAGTLLVNGTLGGTTSLVVVSSGGTLGGSGTIGGSVTVSDGVIAPGNGTGTLTINGNLTLSSNSTLSFELGQAGTVGGSLNDLIVVNGNLTLAGTVTVTQSQGGTYGPGLYRLISYNGTLTNDGVTLGSVPSGSVNFIQTEIAGQVNLVNTQGVVARYWDGDAGGRNDGAISGGNGSWTAARSGASSDDWTIADGSINGAFDSGSFAVFQGSAGVVTVNDTAGAVTVGGMQFVTNGYRVTGDAITLASGSNTIRVGDGTAAGASTVAQIDAVLAGSGGLVKNDLGTLVLTATNTYSGGTTIAAGKLTGAAASFGTGAIVNNASLVVAGAGTLANAMSGSGTLEKTGTGTLTLSGTNSFSGGTTISGGTLVGTTASLPGSVVDNATLEFNQNFDGTFAGNISGTGNMVKDGTGTVTLTGLISYTGSTTVLAGQLVGNTSNIGGTVTDTGQVTFDQGFDATYGNSITGSGSLVKSGTGTVTLTGVNSYTGGTTVLGGTLIVTTSSLPGSVVDDATLKFNQNFDGTFAGNLSGTGLLVKDGTGTVTLTGLVSFAGSTTILAGQLVGNTSNIGGAVTNSGQLTFNQTFDGTYDRSISGSGSLVKSGTGTVTLTGTSSYKGGTLVQAGTLAIGNSQALGSGAVTLNEGTTLAFAGDMTFANTLSFPQVGDPIIDTGSDNVTVSGSISGVGDLSKTGSGTLDLTAANTYTGATDIRAGTLLVDGSTAASVVTVEGGAILGGSGTIGGLVARSGSTVAPGVALPYSTLSVVGNVTFEAGSVYQVRVSASGQTDSLVATGMATINGGTVAVLAGSGTYSPTTTYKILSAGGGRSGEFAALSTATNLAFLTPVLTYDATSVSLGFTSPGTGGTPAGLFPSMADTPNEKAAATAIQGLGAGNSLYDAVLSQSVTGARQAFDAASGEIHASAVTAGVEGTRMVREAMTTRMIEADRPNAGSGAQTLDGPAPALPDAARGYAALDTSAPRAPLPRFALWGQGFGDFGGNGGNHNAATLTRSLGGFVIGGDTRIDAAYFNDWLVGLVGGYGSEDLRVNDRSSSGTYQSAFAGLYASARYGALGIRLGMTAGGTWTDSQRSVAFANFLQQDVTSHSAGDVVQGFGELGYRVSLARGFVEPVVGGAVIHLDQDGFRESTGPASLTGASQGYDVETVTTGLRAEATLFADLPVTLRTFLGYRHAFGDVNPKALLAFEAGSSSFRVTGAPLDRDALVTELGVDYKTASPWTVGIGYSGQYGARADSSAVKGKVEYQF